MYAICAYVIQSIRSYLLLGMFKIIIILWLNEMIFMAHRWMQSSDFNKLRGSRRRRRHTLPFNSATAFSHVQKTIEEEEEKTQVQASKQQFSPSLKRKESQVVAVVAATDDDDLSSVESSVVCV